MMQNGKIMEDIKVGFILPPLEIEMVQLKDNDRAMQEAMEVYGVCQINPSMDFEVASSKGDDRIMWKGCGGH